ncbi:MAG: isovaleryl-CoA dehydrogenase [Pseudomonadota bacterium]
MHAQSFNTHDIVNQSPPFENVNLFATDRALQEAVAREGAEWAADALTAFGESVGSARGFEIGRLANENPPRLKRFDPKGFPADVVEYHPAYHEAMAMSFAAGMHCTPGVSVSDTDPASKGGTGGQVARLGHLYLMTQVEAGHVCPVTMTHASISTLKLQPEIYTPLQSLLNSRTYDRSFQPHAQKNSITIGMGMTEKQGGTDVRANTTCAVPCSAPGPGNAYQLIGHKWFLSAPMSDAFLMLAQARGGLSCFFVPRFRPDGTVNAIRLQRLKDKLGNRSNASSEVELQNAHGWLIGEEGRGIPTIIEMVTMTRLDCAVASAGQMRLAIAMALFHCRQRTVFQKRLVDQTLMAGVLADMALDVEASTALAFRLAHAFDCAADDEREAAWQRVMTPVTKYWVCKLAPALGYEAMECLGGNGYVEDGMAARLYRELPLNAIWEGSGNVMCLDLLRVLRQAPDQARLVFDEIRMLANGEHRLISSLSSIEAYLSGNTVDLELHARGLVEDLARTASGALLHAHAPTAVADAFLEARFGTRFQQTYGAGFHQCDTAAILERALPEI